MATKITKNKRYICTRCVLNVNLQKKFFFLALRFQKGTVSRWWWNGKTSLYFYRPTPIDVFSRSTSFINQSINHWSISIFATSGAGTAYPSEASEITPGFRVTRCVCFVDRCLSFCTFLFGHFVVFYSIFGFWLPFWYLQTLVD